MNRSKKLLLILFAMVFAVAAIALVACKPDEPPEHTHTFAEDWTFDNTNHWHAATCEHSEQVADKAAHKFDSQGECSACHYREPVPTHTVTFVADEQTVGTVTFSEGDESVKEPDVPEKPHYSGVWGSYTLGAADVTVNAVYTPIEYKVTFAVDDNTSYERTYTAENKDSFSAPSVPERRGYTGEWESYELNFQDVTVNAVYTPIEYKITFAVDDNTSYERTYTAENKDSFSAPSVPERRGYTGAWESYELNFQDVTVNAVYTPIEYTITYHNVDGAINPNPAGYTVEDEELTLAAAVRYYFDFVGWYTDENGADKVDAIDTSQLKNVELWAKWQSNDDVFVFGDEEKTVVFGSYPQTRITDNGMIANLNAEIGNGRPSADNAEGWQDYGYYIAGNVEAYMWYRDVEYKQMNYRAVYLAQYRPYRTTDGAIDPDYPPYSCYQYQNGYELQTVYWFRFDPITWRVLSKEGNKVFLMANVILDGQAYQTSYDSSTYFTQSNNAPEGTYANNYKYSTIRAWLNDSFYNTAFGESDKERVLLTNVDNSVGTTQNGDSYVCENTEDRVFLLSWQDVKNSEYGFNDNQYLADANRMLKPTDYAICQGAYFNPQGDFGYWWLRSPYSWAYKANFADQYGKNSASDYVENTQGGVVPAIYLNVAQ